ncbi:MAG: DUF4128 domain-containing protein [Hyphomicrobiales bacterium]|nr:DUF4128 domain-containing protein [Hyphomicrobiales bacterium]
MALNVESAIAEALFAHLSGMTDGWPVAWENSAFDPPEPQYYYRVQLIPGPTESAHTDATQYRWFGVFRVFVVVPQKTGSIGALDQAGRIVERFADLSEITSTVGFIQITRRPEVMGGLTDDQTYRVPVDIRYELFSN